jgi:serine phosphatase RsbU (regulator of sigma subunit)
MEQNNKARVALVDDETLVLGSLRLLFETVAGYEILVFANPTEALKTLAGTPVDVVISDYLMPELNGIDLLTKVQQLQPEASRILLTGFADKQNAIRAINEAGLYRYIEKPWDNDQLLLTVRSALQEKSLRRQLAEKVRLLDRLMVEHSELAEREQRLQRELEMAARVQRSLLPSRFPDLNGFRITGLYHPCQAVGGDFYDFVTQDAESLILVSDVAGHGLQAALISMMVKAIFQDVGLQTEEPATLLAEINARLRRILPEGLYVAAGVVCLDSKNFGIRVANAGLPYPFVMRTSQHKLDEIPISGIPLGLFDDSGPDSFDVRRIEMDPGDTLLFASDGLREVPNTQGEFLGDRQLYSTLSRLLNEQAERLTTALMEDAARFSDQPPPDDVTLVTITRI